MSKRADKSPYHHGNLRESLVIKASEMLHVEGIDGLSMRKLADAVGVSRTALYHHFQDKNALLCAIAEQGFARWHATSERIFNQAKVKDRDKVRQFVHDYINYAADNPQLYELMFGRTLWKNATPTESLKSVAYPSFQHQVTMTKRWQQQGLMPANEDTLRLAQVTWGTLHGIARLLIDGIYADRTHIDEMCECAVNLFSQPNR
ncbi:TetR/AcrR family transcriptional regulator [Alteromonas oceanisediminis]|uniref:TetR/AcrR family transcriptional regulator n=1 Tax=Alteromonas oceanisediminis TaxID=2836180 RepID=UPI001BDA834E|nr:TetR/AcrR family transcriptional regulator [Alteromonas oceanisediminis]MBT0587443.1 TetR/AcrR family transcriptional regulator [Alteromonas oceanisediminis]